MSENVINLQRKRLARCRHGDYVLDDALAMVECGKCGVYVSPIYVLKEIMYNREAQGQQRARLKLEAEEALKKTKTKCQHCKQMTKIKTDVKDYRVLEAMGELVVPRGLK